MIGMSKPSASRIWYADHIRGIDTHGGKMGGGEMSEAQKFEILFWFSVVFFFSK